MIKPNWDKFKEKFNDNPTYYFEYFCYLLFCLEYNKPQGIFRYKNQSGIEWNPIEVDGKTIVAQCKFYDSTLGDYKKDILKMLDTIQKNYSTPCELKFYTNQDWGQGKEKDTNESKPKIEIENLARKYILENNKLIKKDKMKKNEVLEILNFLVEKGSAIGYMPRERIL